MHSKKPFKRIMVVKSSKVLQDVYNEIIIQPKAYFIFSRYDFSPTYQALRNKYNQSYYRYTILCVFCLNFNYAKEQISNEKWYS